MLRFQPKAGSTNAQRSIVYLNGGGFVQPAMTAHSYMCSLLAHRLNAVVYMFPYELAPAGIAASELPRLTAFYLAVSAHARDLGHEVFVAGDSAGGSIASSMPLCIQRFAPLLLGKQRCRRKRSSKLLPDQLILARSCDDVQCHGRDREAHGSSAGARLVAGSKAGAELCQMCVGTTSVQEAAVQQLASASTSRKMRPKNGARSWPLRADDDMLGPMASPTTFELLQQARCTSPCRAGRQISSTPAPTTLPNDASSTKVECTFIEGEGGVHVYPILDSF